MIYFVSTLLGRWVGGLLIRLISCFFLSLHISCEIIYAEPRVKVQSLAALLLSNLFSFISYPALLVCYNLI